MRINFKIFWFENDLGYIDSRKTEMELLIQFLINKGYHPEITYFIDSDPEDENRFLIQINSGLLSNFRIKKVDNYDTASFSGIDFSDADIVFMDYNLSAENTGDKIIGYIREQGNEFYTEIFFYSSGNPPATWNRILPRQENKTEAYLRELANRDGIFCSHRDGIFEKSERVLQTLIKKSQDLNNLRGLVMAETADIDDLMRKILLQISATSAITDIQIIPQTPCTQCTRKGKSSLKVSNISLLLTSATGSQYKDLIQSDKTSRKELYEAIINFLRSTLNHTTINSSALPVYSQYDNDVCRNILAHQPEDGSNRFTMHIRKTDGNLETFDEVRFNTVRQKIRDYKNTFNQIYTELIQQQASSQSHP